SAASWLEAGRPPFLLQDSEHYARALTSGPLPAVSDPRELCAAQVVALVLFTAIAPGNRVGGSADPTEIDVPFNEAALVKASGLKSAEVKRGVNALRLAGLIVQGSERGTIRFAPLSLTRSTVGTAVDWQAVASS